MNNSQNIDQLKASLEYEKGKYKQLRDKVIEVLDKQQACRDGNNQNHLLRAKWQAEAELRKLLSPNKQVQLWEAR